MSDIDEALEALDRLHATTDQDCFPENVEADYNTIRQALERQRVPESREVYVLVHSTGPDVEFIEIETSDGKGVSVPWRPLGGGMHKIGPLQLAAAPTPEDSDGSR